MNTTFFWYVQFIENFEQNLPKYYCRWPTRNKFIKLLNEEQSSILKKLAKFVYLANEKRTFILHNVADLSTLS